MSAQGGDDGDDLDFHLPVPSPGRGWNFGRGTRKKKKGVKKRDKVDPMLAALIGPKKVQAPRQRHGDLPFEALSKPGAIVNIVELNEQNEVNTTSSKNSGAHAVFLDANAEVENLIGCIQKDLNTLSDPNKKKRYRALAQLHKDFQVLFSRANLESSESKENLKTNSQATDTLDYENGVEPVLSNLFSHVAKPLLKRFGDPGEKCREKAVVIVSEFARLVPNVHQFLPFIIPVLRHRMSSKTEHPYFSKRVQLAGAQDDLADVREENEDDEDLFAWTTPDPTEQSEELRLLNVQLLRIIINKCQKQMLPFLSDTVTLFVLALGDRFPDVKRECFYCIEKVCELFPVKMRGCSVDLAKIVMPSLIHKLARIRIGAIRAIKALIVTGGAAAIRTLTAFREHNIIVLKAFFKGETRVNYFAWLTEDKNPRVRQEFFRLMNFLMKSLHERFNYETLIMPYVLSGLIDDSTEIQKEALATIEHLGAEYEEWNEEKLADQKYYQKHAERISMKYRLEGLLSLYPTPHTARPRIGSREVIMRFTTRYLGPIMRELNDWKSGPKLRSAKLLQTLLLYTEDYINDEVQGIVTTLMKTVRDADIGEEIARCLKLLGRFADFKVLLGEIHRNLATTVDDAKQGNFLLTLTYLIQGAPAEIVAENLEDILEIVSQPDVLHVRESKNLIIFSEFCSAIGKVLSKVVPDSFALHYRKSSSARSIPTEKRARVQNGEESMADSKYYHFKSTDEETAKLYRPIPLDSNAKATMRDTSEDGKVTTSEDYSKREALEGILKVYVIASGIEALVSLSSPKRWGFDSKTAERISDNLDTCYDGLKNQLFATPMANVSATPSGDREAGNSRKFVSDLCIPILLQNQVETCMKTADCITSDSFDVLLLQWFSVSAPKLSEAFSAGILESLAACMGKATNVKAKKKMVDLCHVILQKATPTDKFCRAFEDMFLWVLKQLRVKASTVQPQEASKDTKKTKAEKTQKMRKARQIMQSKEDARGREEAARFFYSLLAIFSELVIGKHYHPPTRAFSSILKIFNSLGTVKDHSHNSEAKKIRISFAKGMRGWKYKTFEGELAAILSGLFLEGCENALTELAQLKKMVLKAADEAADPDECCEITVHACALFCAELSGPNSRALSLLEDTLITCKAHSDAVVSHVLHLFRDDSQVNALLERSAELRPFLSAYSGEGC